MEMGDSAVLVEKLAVWRSKRARSVKSYKGIEPVLDNEDFPKKRKSKKPQTKAVKKAKKSDNVKVKKPDVNKALAGSSSSSTSTITNQEEEIVEGDALFVVESSVPMNEAIVKWPKRYQDQNNGRASSSRSKMNDVPSEIIQARRHFTQADVDGNLYNLLDDAHVWGKDELHICQIVEFFESLEGEEYFTAQWYYRSRDTVIGDTYKMNEKRVYFSEIMDVNPLCTLVEKLKIIRLPLGESQLHTEEIAASHYYCDMLYFLPFSTFVQLPQASEPSSTISSDDNNDVCDVDKKKSYSLLDLYCGCGGMSTGLSMGANLGKLNLVTKWAVDLNLYACQSLRLNHPETQVRNETVDDFLSLLKEWEKLCIRFSLSSNTDPTKFVSYPFDNEESEAEDTDEEDDDIAGEEIFEVEKVLAICYGDPKRNKNIGLYFKVHWKGYGPNEDSWEPLAGLSNCRQTIEAFVRHGFESKILPIPGDVDVICGGPPCQGISGFNRFRDKKNPFADVKNKQLLTYMDVVNFLRPKFVLMENVVDLLKFSEGFFGRYAMGSLVGMNYQIRMGMMAAGSYGLPQYRLRVFIWGACPNERLPQFPLPTHDVVGRGVAPVQFESNNVAYEKGVTPVLEEKLLLVDAISDLPEVNNNEARDVMPYEDDPNTEFQRFIRKRKEELLATYIQGKKYEHLLYDHRPLELNVDDYQRVCQIPKEKGACFRDLKGILVSDKRKVQWDPAVERVLLDSGKPLVPDYAMSFVRGTSFKPFGRLWWDETVPTVVTRAEPHNQQILHPLQNRVLTIRENARLQGFPDFYQLIGPVKERYIQVGNAVAVPVARALGYSLAMAWRRTLDDDFVFSLPQNFPNINENEPEVEASS